MQNPMVQVVAQGVVEVRNDLFEVIEVLRRAEAKLDEIKARLDEEVSVDDDATMPG